MPIFRKKNNFDIIPRQNHEVNTFLFHHLVTFYKTFHIFEKKESLGKKYKKQEKTNQSLSHIGSNSKKCFSAQVPLSPTVKSVSFLIDPQEIGMVNYFIFFFLYFKIIHIVARQHAQNFIKISRVKNNKTRPR